MRFLRVLLLLLVVGALLGFDALPLSQETLSPISSLHAVSLVQYKADRVLISSGAVWKFHDQGTDQGAAWIEPSFDDSSWSEGAAELGYGDGDEATVVSYGPDPQDKYITTYFRHAFQVSSTEAMPGMQLRLKHDDGAVVYLNGVEIIRSNLPSGDLDYLTTASTVCSDEDSFQTYAINYQDLVFGKNLLAVEVHQFAPTSSDISFDLELFAPLRGVGDPIRFAVVSDMRQFAGPGTYDSTAYFRGAAEAIHALGGMDWIMVAGDMDPTEGVAWTIEQVFGDAFPWIPIVGNHELPGGGTEGAFGENMEWLRSYAYGPINPGPSGCPETTYSFDFSHAHFIVLNEYCDAGGDDVTLGDIPDHLFDWLEADLASQAAEHIIVLGHEPGYPQPDADTGRMRHEYDSLNQFPTNRDRFWALMNTYDVAAYFCGHTHNYSAVQVEGVWQLDSGHARGMADSEVPGTFIVIEILGSEVTYYVYRDDASGGAYSLLHQGILANFIYFPFVSKSSP